MPSLLSLNVGKPRDVDWRGRTVRTGAWKSPVSGPRTARRLNIDGDGQGDLAGHGGEIRAVLVYQAESYTYWRSFLGRDDLTYGGFGENFTVDGLPDDAVCIGDRYRVGGAEFEVTQPRVTCYRVGMRLGEPALASLLVAHHRPGFYLRVITEGDVQAGDEIVRTRSGPGGVTVAEADALLYLPGRDPARLRVALGIPALSPGWRRSFEELTEEPGAGDAAADGPADTAPPAGFRPFRVTRIVPETPDVTSVHLAPADGAPPAPARPGQFLTVRLTDGPQPHPVRSYSLSGAPGGAGYRISVKREPHGLVSTHLNTRIAPGAALDVAAPRGGFVLTPGTRPVVLLSAGIGATPLLAMLHDLAARRDPRPVRWIHVTRDAGHQVFAAEVPALLDRLPDARQHTFVTAPGAVAGPHRTAGRPTAERLAALGLPTDADHYVCGPAAFMTAVRAALAGAGVPEERMHTESFGSLAPVNPGVAAATAPPPHQPPGPPGTGPAVTFARSGLTTRWSDGHASLLELAEACDVPTRWSCRTGVCHTCTTPVVDGTTAYDVPPLEEPPAGETLICCAHPTSDLLLDL